MIVINVWLKGMSIYYHNSKSTHHFKSWFLEAYDSSMEWNENEVETACKEPCLFIDNFNQWNCSMITTSFRTGYCAIVCPLSALLFILVVEILATKIRSNKEIKGVQIGDTEHKIVQYADDAT